MNLKQKRPAKFKYDLTCRYECFRESRHLLPFDTSTWNACKDDLLGQLWSGMQMWTFWWTNYFGWIINEAVFVFHSFYAIVHAFWSIDVEKHLCFITVKEIFDRCSIGSGNNISLEDFVRCWVAVHDQYDCLWKLKSTWFSYL